MVMLRAPPKAVVTQLEPHSFVENVMATMWAVLVSVAQMLKEANCWRRRTLADLRVDVQAQAGRRTCAKIAAAALALTISMGVFLAALLVQNPSAKTWIISIGTMVAVLIEAALAFALGDWTGPPQAARAILSQRARAASLLVALVFAAATSLAVLHSADWTTVEINDNALLLLAGTFCFGATVVHLILASCADGDFCKQHVLAVAAISACAGAIVQREFPEDRMDRCLAMSLQALLIPTALEAGARLLSDEPPTLAGVLLDVIAVVITLLIGWAAYVILPLYPEGDVLLMVSAVCLLGPLAGTAQLIVRFWCNQQAA